jgi:large repetitive protein
VQDHEEVGVPGVRFYLEDGTYLVSDVEGKYSLCGISPTTHVLKADATTLPVGAALDTLDNRNAGDPDSRFLDPRNGELHRGDFAIRNCSVEVRRQVMGRRTQGEVQVPDVEKHPDPVETLDTRREVRPQQPRGAAASAGGNKEAAQ